MHGRHCDAGQHQVAPTSLPLCAETAVLSIDPGGVGLFGELDCLGS